MFLIWSCSSLRSKNSFNQEELKNETQHIQNIDSKYLKLKEDSIDSVVLIELPNKDLIKWNNYSHKIILDSLFGMVIDKFSENQKSYLNLILDTSATRAKVCSIERNLFVGDLAFLIIHEIKHLPLADILQKQCDAFMSGCPYSVGFFNALDQNRLAIKGRIELNLKNRLKIENKE